MGQAGFFSNPFLVIKGNQSTTCPQQKREQPEWLKVASGKREHILSAYGFGSAHAKLNQRVLQHGRELGPKKTDSTRICRLEGGLSAKPRRQRAVELSSCGNVPFEWRWDFSKQVVQQSGILCNTLRYMTFLALRAPDQIYRPGLLHPERSPQFY